MRLSKAIASAGLAARRKAEELVFGGKVKVNGEVVLLPQTKVDIAKDRIEVEGRKLESPEKKVYYLLNKPAGYICTSQDAEKEASVFNLVEEERRLFSVGRLDKDTKGLLILTNDGHFAEKLIHPRYCLEREYVAKVDREVDHADLVKLSKGIVVEGTKVVPLSVKKVRRGTLKIIVQEGRKREVRLLLKECGYKVLELLRIRLGSLLLGKLPEGSYRPITETERRQLIGERLTPP
jgi:23S rRNA pseudouridine2605 synthase